MTVTSNTFDNCPAADDDEAWKKFVCITLHYITLHRNFLTWPKKNCKDHKVAQK